MQDSLKKLAELTETLPPFPPRVDPDDTARVEYKMAAGKCFGIRLGGPDTRRGVHDWFNSGGTEFPEHAHTELEYIIVYQGCVSLHTDDRDVDIGPGDCYRVDPDHVHSASFSEDTLYLTVTIPKAPQFP